MSRDQQYELSVVMQIVRKSIQAGIILGSVNVVRTPHTTLSDIKKKPNLFQIENVDNPRRRSMRSK